MSKEFRPLSAEEQRREARVEIAVSEVYALAGKLTNYDSAAAVNVLVMAIWKLYTSDGVPAYGKRYIRGILADMLSEMLDAS